MNNIQVLKHIEKAEKFLRFVKITLLTKVDFPSEVEIKKLNEAKICLDEAQLLLNAEAETNGEKDCKNDGNAV